MPTARCGSTRSMPRRCWRACSRCRATTSTSRSIASSASRPTTPMPTAAAGASAARAGPILNMRPRGNMFNYGNDTHFIDWLEEMRPGLRRHHRRRHPPPRRAGAGALSLRRSRGSHPEYYQPRDLGRVRCLPARRRPAHVSRRQRLLLAHRLSSDGAAHDRDAPRHDRPAHLGRRGRRDGAGLHRRAVLDLAQQWPSAAAPGRRRFRRQVFTHSSPYRWLDGCEGSARCHG